MKVGQSSNLSIFFYDWACSVRAAVGSQFCSVSFKSKSEAENESESRDLSMRSPDEISEGQ